MRSLLFVLCYVLGYAYNANFSKTIRMSTKYSISPAIGLAKQSVIDVEFSSINGDNPVLLMVYNEKQRPDEFTYSDSLDDHICLQPSTFRMEITKPERIHIIIEEENQYSVLLLNCYPTAVTVAGQIQIRNRYNGMLVNLSVEEQLEVLIWPTVFVLYIIVFVVFLIINSKARFRGTPFLRHVDIVLESIVFTKILSSFLQSCIILYTLYYSTVNILSSRSTAPSLHIPSSSI